jgi:methanol metabolism-related c-type cytochrome
MDARPFYFPTSTGDSKTVTRYVRILLLGLVFAIAGGTVARADAPGNPKAVTETNGLWTDQDGVPTYKIEKDGTVDWGTFVGYLRFNSICMVCHGPDGMGSTYAPALVDSLKHLTYAQFLATVAAGKRAVNSSQDLVMPAEGMNKNVMCFINEIYTYLRARSTGALGRGRPEKHAPSPKGFDKASYECLGIPQ